jgi:hypothetical protein
MSRVAILASIAAIALAPALLPAQTTSPYPNAYVPIPSSSGIDAAAPVQDAYTQITGTAGPDAVAQVQNPYPQTTLGAYPMGRAPAYPKTKAIAPVQGAYPETNLSAVPFRDGATVQTYAAAPGAAPQTFLVVNPACVSVVKMSPKGSASREAYPPAAMTVIPTPQPTVETATTGMATTAEAETVIGTAAEGASTTEAMRPVKIIQPKTAATAATTPQTTVEEATTTTTTTEAAPTVTTYVTTPAATTEKETTETTETKGTANRMMPETGVDWLALVLGGSALSGLGIALRRIHA